MEQTLKKETDQLLKVIELSQILKFKIFLASLVVALILLIDFLFRVVGCLFRNDMFQRPYLNYLFQFIVSTTLLGLFWYCYYNYW